MLFPPRQAPVEIRDNREQKQSRNIATQAGELQQTHHKQSSASVLASTTPEQCGALSPIQLVACSTHRVTREQAARSNVYVAARLEITQIPVCRCCPCACNAFSSPHPHRDMGVAASAYIRCSGSVARARSWARFDVK